MTGDLEQLLADQAPPRDLVSLANAARRLSVPYGTVKSWASRGQIHRAGIELDGSDVYDLAHIRRLADTTKRRKRRQT